MAWDFETDAEFQGRLDAMDVFVREEVEPLEFVLDSPYDVRNPKNIKLVRPLQRWVKEQGLWACHLGEDLGGQGFGQVKLALMNEILGRARFGPVVFGCQAPDTGNAEILAHYGTDAQKERYLQPLLDNEIVSCFSMTELQGGADPTVFTTHAERDDNSWVINGEKWFSSNASYASFLITMAITDPQAAPHKRMSMFIIPKETPGLEIVRDVGVGFDTPRHAYLRYKNVRVPHDHMLGQPGEAFAVAQTRLGGGRIHHAMRMVGAARRAFDMMCERAVSRHTQGTKLSEKQMVQEKIADSWIELEQFRLLLLRTAWLIDKHKDYRAVRKDISAVKAAMPKILHDIAARALQIHGALGLSTEMPFVAQIIESFHLGLADGPTEVHKVTLAKELLRKQISSSDEFPSYHLPTRRRRALEKYADALDEKHL